MLQPFSVLIPVYGNDHPGHFCRSLESVLSQDPCPEQIVVVRDGPVPDNLQQVVSHYREELPEVVTVVELATNRGLSAALNEGLPACRNEFIARQDADDISEPTRFAKQLDAFERVAGAVLISAWYDEYDAEMEVRRGTRRIPEDNRDIWEFGRHRTPINHACAIFKKTAVLNVGGYPTIDGFCEDWWLSLKLMRAGGVLYNVQESLVKVRGGDAFLRRRRGYGYARQEIANQLAMYREGLLRGQDVVVNTLIRVPIRLIPHGLLDFFYRHIARAG